MSAAMSTALLEVRHLNVAYATHEGPHARRARRLVHARSGRDIGIRR